MTSNVLPHHQKLSKRSFIVRADENGESVAIETVEEVETEIDKPLRKPIVKLGKQLKHVMRKGQYLICERETVEIKKEVPNKRRRFTFYRGIVMSKQNAGIHTTVHIRRIIAGIGVEIVFPV